jgi:hypothetical protein
MELNFNERDREILLEAITKLNPMFNYEVTIMDYDSLK